MDDAVARLIVGRLFGVCCINRHPQEDAPIALMAGFVPNFAVDGDVDLQRFEPITAQADEERQSLLSHRLEGPRRRGRHPHRRVRFLNRNRDQLRVNNLIVFSIMTKFLASPGFPQDRQRFLEPFLTLAVVDIVNLVLPREAATPDTEIEAPTADLVDRRRFLRNPQRIGQRQDINRHTNTNPFGTLRKRTSDDDGGRQN